MKVVQCACHGNLVVPITQEHRRDIFLSFYSFAYFNRYKIFGNISKFMGRLRGGGGGGGGGAGL